MSPLPASPFLVPPSTCYSVPTYMDISLHICRYMYVYILMLESTYEGAHVGFSFWDCVTLILYIPSPSIVLKFCHFIFLETKSSQV